MISREIKRLQMRYEKLLEPFGILFLTLLFILPTLAVLNLSPISKSEPKNVLGVGDGKGISTVLVGGVHDIMKQELLTFPNETQTEYRTQIIKRDKGTYSKPILQIVNDSSESNDVLVSGLLGQNENTTVSIIVNDQRYILQNSKGEPFIQKISLEPTSENIVYLQLENSEGVRFNNNISLKVLGK